MSSVEIFTQHPGLFKGLDSTGIFLAISAIGDNFYDFLVALLHAKAFLKMGYAIYLRDSKEILNRSSAMRLGVIVLGPVVQSLALTSSLVVKILTVLVNTISNLQVFLLKKM